MILAIIGLAGAAASHLLAVACLLAGGGLLFSGGAEGARLRMSGEAMSEWGAGIGAEFIGGAGAIVLGILALVGVAPLKLAPIAAILLGAALVRSAVGPAREWWFGSTDVHGADRARQGAAAVQGLVGVAVLALGILAVIGIAPLALGLTALLCVGTSMMLTGSTLFAGAVLVRRQAAA